VSRSDGPGSIVSTAQALGEERLVRREARGSSCATLGTKVGPAVLKFLITCVFKEVAAGAERQSLKVVGINREGIGLLSLEDRNRILDSLAIVTDRRENTS